MSSPETITLVVVSDDHYVVLLSALIRSVEANISNGVQIDLWVIADNISPGNMRRMEASVDRRITAIHWKNIQEVLSVAGLPKDRSSYPLNIYARLFIPDLMPAGVEKVLYLDVDMIVLADLAKLWRTDITGYFLAAVSDQRVHTFDNHWGGILNYKELGLSGTSKYFNTGLLLINVAGWREHKIAEKILKVISDNLKYANYPDQYGLNVVLSGKWLELDARWNFFATADHDDPYIIHFIDRKPIYRSYKNSSIYRDHFYKYLNDTAWKGTKPIGEAKRGVKKIKNILRKIISNK